MVCLILILLRCTVDNGNTSKVLQMSSIFEGVLDAFKLIGFQPNFKHSTIRACADHSKRHQGDQPQSGTSKSSSTPAKNLQMSSIFEGVLDAFKLIGFQWNFKHSSLRAYANHPKHHQGHQPQSGTSKSSSTPAKNLQMSSILEGVLDYFKLIGFQPNFKNSSLRAYADHP